MAGKVIAGDYLGEYINSFGGIASITIGWLKSIEINKDTVESYEVIDKKSKTKVTSALGRAAVGNLLLGPVGLAAAVTAKKKGTHMIALEFKDGKKSLIEIDDKIYKAIMKSLF